jgi:hypothetical protein
LSHWPATPTPEELWHDVSAGIVLHALARPRWLPEGVEVASVDHYDADGVISLALLCVEGLAADHGALLVDAARVGDFDVVGDRRAALVAFGLGALGDVTEALATLPGLVEDPERYRALWAEEAEAFDTSVRALSEGWAAIEERPRHDLAIVRVDTSHPDASRAAWEAAPLHRAAVHSATERLRVATMAQSGVAQGDVAQDGVARGGVELRYRYESWVRMVSCRPRPRVDLGAIATELTRSETSGGRWVFDGAGAITGALHLADGTTSSLDPEDVVDAVCRELESLDAGPPAWDPYAPSGVPA